MQNLASLEHMFFRPIRVGIELQVCLKKKKQSKLCFIMSSVFFLMITFLLCVSKTQSSGIMPIVTSQRAARNWPGEYRLTGKEMPW